MVDLPEGCVNGLLETIGSDLQPPFTKDAEGNEMSLGLMRMWGYMDGIDFEKKLFENGWNGDYSDCSLNSKSGVFRKKEFEDWCERSANVSIYQFHTRTFD